MKKTGVGFMTEKMLKTALVTEGNAALKYVYKKCKTTFQDENEAVEKFSPTTAVECLAYLASHNAEDNYEHELTEKIDEELERLKKIAEEKDNSIDFKEKYKSLFKAKNDIEKELKNLKKENKRLEEEKEQSKTTIETLVNQKKELEQRNEELLEKISDLKKANDKKDDLIRSMREEKEKMVSEIKTLNENNKKLVSEKEEIVVLLNQKENEKEKMIFEHTKILAITESLNLCDNCENVDYTNVHMLERNLDIVSDYDLVLYVSGSMTFTLQRQISKRIKNENALKKFNTVNDMKNYIKEG